MKHLQKNYFSSSALATYKEFNFGTENLPKEFCLVSNKQNNIKISLEQFMENQEKKHLSTKFNKKEVESFLKDKDAAMEEINIDENISDKKENPNNKINNENNNENKNSIIINKAPNDTKSSHILIFKGTFGNEQFKKILNEEHHHYHHHHHHHHHHHQNNNNHENNGIQN